MKTTTLLGTLSLSVGVLLAACSPTANAPPVDQQLLTGAKLAVCVAGDALLGKSILTIASDCGQVGEQIVVDILADLGINAPGIFGGKLPDQYASDARVQASMSKARAAAAMKHAQ